MTRKFAELPSQARIKELLDYDPETGIFRWKHSRGPNKANEVAGWKHYTGYLYIGFDNQQFKAHRLAWVFIHGCPPAGMLDHIDRDIRNNRISNLREASEQQNNQNKRPYRNSRTGVKGIGWSAQSRKWRARIQANGRVHSLGLFSSFEEALQARQTAETALHIFQERGLSKS